MNRPPVPFAFLRLLSAVRLGWPPRPPLGRRGSSDTPAGALCRPATVRRVPVLALAFALVAALPVVAQDDFFLEGFEDFADEEEQDQGEQADAGEPAAEQPQPAEDAGQEAPETGDTATDQSASTPEPAPATQEAQDVSDDDVDAIADDEEDMLPPTAKELRIDEEVRRKERELRAEHYVIQAREAWRKGNFETAVDLFNKADERLKAISRTQPRVIENRERIKQAIGAVNADWARTMAMEAAEQANVDKFDAAISKAEEAAKKDPGLRKEMDSLIRRFAAMQQEAEFRDAVKPDSVVPDRVDKAFEINVLLEQGKVFFRSGRYADARDKFEQVLIRDPYEVRAMRYLRDINNRLINLSEERRKTTVRERIAEVRWKWNEPVTPLVSEGRQIGPSPVDKTESSLMRKLENIVIPNIDFEDASIQAVVEFLKKRSVELDPEGDGVNIILYEQAREAPEAGAAQERAQEPMGGGDMGGGEFDFFDEGGGGGEGDFGGDEFDFGGEGAGGAGNEPAAQPAQPAGAAGKRITLTLDRIPLGEAIRYICLAAGLKYRVDTNAVLIAGKDVVIDEVETRFYSVEAGVLGGGGGGAAGGGGGGGGGDDGGFGDFGGDFEDGGDGDGDGGGGGGGTMTGGGPSSQQLRLFFSQLGVNFPAGSRIAYYQRAGKLVVTNTPKNLRALEKALKEINKTPPQVTIEAKFVEVAQDDLQELGFNWLLEEGSGFYDDGIVWGSGTDNWAMQVLKQTGTTGKTAPKLSNALRFGDSVFAQVAEGSDQILSVNSILGGVSFSTILHALKQRTNSDILSSPKVTTLNDVPAILKMVTTRAIATGWSDPELDSDEEGDTFTPSIPETEERDFGVILDVTPRVAPDGYTMELDLYPRVMEFIGYDDRFNYDVVLDGQSFEAKNMTPITSERSVQTKVIVWDGETVVLGGMMGERVNYWHDRVPVLGDVPVLGRLFRSKGELSEKTNLLIFVTARLVNPAGMPKRTAEIRGLPDFRR